MQRALHSAKFWTAIVDALIATISFLITIFLKPDAVQEVLIVIGIWQPVVMLVIKGWTDEDAAEKAMGSFDPS